MLFIKFLDIYIKGLMMKDKIREALSKLGAPEEGGSNRYEKVFKLLQNPIYNHAAIIEQLYGDSEASNRSKFRKKLNRLPNDSGSKYEFDDVELSKILNILSTTSNEALGTITGKKSKKDN